MGEPVSTPPAEPVVIPDTFPPERTHSSVEPAAQPDVSTPAAPSEPAVQPDPLPREPSVAPAPQPNPTPSAPEIIPPPPVVERVRKRRRLEEVGFENSAYFKIRTIVKNLRPSFVQVVQNPNFQETNLAGDILKEIKTVVELSKKLRSNLAALTEPRKASSIPPAKDEPNDVCTPNNLKGGSSSDNNLSSKDAVGAELKDVPKNLEDGFKGSYVVGGSPVGWNFLVYPGSKPMYYGRTKAEKQACQIEN